jgi:hypothetical protein
MPSSIKHRALRRIAFVVDGQRTATVGKGAVVDDGDALRGHPAADAAGEGRTALAVEIAFQAVTDRLVQQDAGPARAEDDRHRARPAPGGRRDWSPPDARLRARSHAAASSVKQL